MKSNILPAIKLTFLSIILLTVIYPLAVWGIAQFSPNSGKGEIITSSSKTYYANIGQSFTDDGYFNSRPSAVRYNAAGSGASNKGASNADYLLEVQTRIDTFLVHNPSVNKAELPVDLITSSGSGLDPNISIQAAKVQIKRIAQVRNISEVTLEELIIQHTEKPLFGLFGPEKLNVLKLNLGLDKLK